MNTWKFYAVITVIEVLCTHFLLISDNPARVEAGLFGAFAVGVGAALTLVTVMDARKVEK